MKKEFMFIIFIVGLILINGCTKNIKSNQIFCRNDNDCELEISCCDYVCKSNLIDDTRSQCDRYCTDNPEIPPGPDPKCVCQNNQCIRNLD